MIHLSTGSDIGFLLTVPDDPPWYVASMDVADDVRQDLTQAQYIPTAMGAALAMFLEAVGRDVPSSLRSMLEKAEAVPPQMRRATAGWARAGGNVHASWVHSFGDGDLVVFAHDQTWVAVWTPPGLGAEPMLLDAVRGGSPV